MLSRHWLKAGIALCLCGLLCSGCGTFKRGKDRDAGVDELMPEQLEGDFALSERHEAGDRITDVMFENVLFAYDSFQIAPGETAKIERVATYMSQNPGVSLVLEGHCDERGSREYNVSLGEYRALAVRAHLIRLGVDAERIQTLSYGEEQPLDPGHSESAWRVNRRVEFALYR